MRVTYNKRTNEALTSFYYEGQILFNLHARGEEIIATFYADNRIRESITQNEEIEQAMRDQVRKRPWASYSIHSLKDFIPFLGLVRAKYHLLSEEKKGQNQISQGQLISL